MLVVGEDGLYVIVGFDMVIVMVVGVDVLFVLVVVYVNEFVFEYDVLGV